MFDAETKQVNLLQSRILLGLRDTVPDFISSPMSFPLTKKASLSQYLNTLIFQYCGATINEPILASNWGHF